MSIAASLSLSQAMAQSSAGIAERMPLGSGGWANGAWLYEVIDKALDQAEKVAVLDPEAHLKVMVYADGVGKSPERADHIGAEVMNDHGASATRQRVDARIRQMRQRYRNFDVLSVLSAGDATLRKARLVRLVTDRNQDLYADKQLRAELQPSSAKGRDPTKLLSQTVATTQGSAGGSVLAAPMTLGAAKIREGQRRLNQAAEKPAGSSRAAEREGTLLAELDAALMQTSTLDAASEAADDVRTQPGHAGGEDARGAAATGQPRRAGVLEVVLPAGLEPHIHRPAALRVQSSIELKDLRWDFGEGGGWVTGDEAEKHTWKRYGEYRVRARARNPEGQEVESAPVVVKVPVRPVAVKAAVAHEGRVVDLEHERLPVDAVVQLHAVQTGDVLHLRWYLDNEELAASQQQLPVRQIGSRNLRVVAEGTPEAGTAESTREVRTRDHSRFWGGLVGLAVSLGAMAWLLLGNRWRFAEFQVRTDGAALANPTGQAGLPHPDADLRWLGRQGPRSCGRWNPLTKRAVISLAALDNRLRPRSSDEGYRALFAQPTSRQQQRQEPGELQAKPFAWTRRDGLVFAGLDLPEPRGRLAAVRPAAAGDPVNAGRGQIDRWLRCWVVARPGVPAKRPHAQGAGPTYATLAVFMRLREPGLARRLWPEALFAGFCVAAALAAYRLHEIYF